MSSPSSWPWQLDLEARQATLDDAETRLAECRARGKPPTRRSREPSTLSDDASAHARRA